MALCFMRTIYVMADIAMGTMFKNGLIRRIRYSNDTMFKNDLTCHGKYSNGIVS